MIVNKLLSIKKDNNIILYIVSFDTEKLYKFLDQCNKKYSRIENDVLETTFSGIMPLSYGKYDSMKDICNVKELGVVENKKEKQSEEYFKSLGGTSKEWNFLSDAEKMLFMPISGTKKGRIKLEVEYPSILCKTLKDTFLSENEDDCIIDGTKLIKLGNHVLGLPNKFIYDKTIDLKKRKRNWNDPSISFLNVKDYENYLLKSKNNINKDDVKISKREEKNIYNDFEEILYKLEDVMYAEQIGMFPMNIDLTYELEILKRYGIRNEHFEWLDHLCKFSRINYDGGAILNKFRNQIYNNYDLNGVKTNEKLIEKAEKNSIYIKKLFNKDDDKEETPIVIPDYIELQKIKAA